MVDILVTTQLADTIDNVPGVGTVVLEMSSF